MVNMTQKSRSVSSVKLTNCRNGLNKGFSGVLKKEIDRLFEENIDRKRDICQDIGKIDTRDTKSCCRKPDIEGDNSKRVRLLEKCYYWK